MTLKENRPLIIGHRGAKAYAPENTMASFKLAVEHKADGVEFDIKFTKDMEIIIIHDLTVDRTTNGKGKVKDYSSEEIRKLDAGSFFSETFNGEKIPILSEVLNNLPRQFLINIEITNYGTSFDGLAKKVAYLVKDLGIGDQIIFSSFNPMNLYLTKQIVPEIPVAILADSGKKGWLSRSSILRGISPKYIHPHFSDVDREFIVHQHDLGRKVNVWTVNDPADILRMADLKVDGIITDNPLLARKTLGLE
ncbi:MAG: glycerophosphodiester phosphodiesterase [Anaerolineaceae bacterium]